jgi:hypothetical protein
MTFNNGNNGKIAARKGYVVNNASTAFGGVRYERENLGEPEKVGPDGKGERAIWQTERIKDHSELCDALDNLKKQVDYALKKNCSRTHFGWFADADQLAKVKTKLAELRSTADALNQRARDEGCGRRVHIGVVWSELDLATEDAAAELAYAIQLYLGTVRDCLRKGEIEPRQYDKHWTKCKNLEKLGVGFGEEVIKLALEEAKTARKAIRERIKLGQTEESAGRQEELGYLKNAIKFFGGEVEDDTEAEAEAEAIADAADSGEGVSAF